MEFQLDWYEHYVVGIFAGMGDDELKIFKWGLGVISSL